MAQNNADDLAITLDTDANGEPVNDDQTIVDPMQQQFNDSVFGQPDLGQVVDRKNTQDGQGGQSDQDAGATDPKRFQYWQSQADREKNRATALEQQLNLYKPLLDLVENDEEVMAVIERKTKPGTRTARPTAPIPPEVPVGYSETEALSNPQSESFKYRKSYEKYLQDRMKFLEAKVEAQGTEFEQRYASEQQQRQADQQRTQVAEYLATKHGFNSAQQGEFIQMMTDPSSLHIDNLVSYYNFRKRSARSGPGSPPPPVGGGGGKGAETADDAFNRMVYAGAKRQFNP